MIQRSWMAMDRLRKKRNMLRLNLYKCFILFLLNCLGLASEEPWGKDTDLLSTSKRSVNNCPAPSFLSQWGERAIKFHQEVISPADGPRSHFIPSSSQYTLEAMRKYGFFTGYMMGCDRLMRENEDEWVYKKTTDPKGRPIKWDPVK